MEPPPSFEDSQIMPIKSGLFTPVQPSDKKKLIY